MITETTMYWLTRMDYLHKLLLDGGLVSAALFAVAGIFIGVASDNLNSEKLERISVRALLCVPLFLFMAILGCFVPTTREMAAIVMVPKIVNNEKVQEVGNGLYDLAMEWMRELKPNGKKNLK